MRLLLTALLWSTLLYTAQSQTCIFGNTDSYLAGVFVNPNLAYYQQYTVEEGGELISLNIDLSVSVDIVNPLGMMGVYSDDNGEVGVLLSKCLYQTVTDGWNSFTEMDPAYLMPGDYWIGFICNEPIALPWLNNGEKDIYQSVENTFAGLSLCPDDYFGIPTHDLPMNMEVACIDGATYCGTGTAWDELSQTCVPTAIADQYCYEGIIQPQFDTEEITSNVAVAKTIEINQEVSFDKIGVYVDDAPPGMMGKFAVYLDADGAPWIPLWESAEFLVGDGLNEISNVSIIASDNTFHIAFICSETYINDQGPADPTSSLLMVHNYDDPWPTFPVYLPYINRDVSIYVTFECLSEICPGDLNADGFVTSSDLLTFLANFGNDCTD